MLCTHALQAFLAPVQLSRFHDALTSSSSSSPCVTHPHTHRHQVSHHCDRERRQRQRRRYSIATTVRAAHSVDVATALAAAATLSLAGVHPVTTPSVPAPAAAVAVVRAGDASTHFHVVRGGGGGGTGTATGSDSRTSVPATAVVLSHVAGGGAEALASVAVTGVGKASIHDLGRHHASSSPSDAASTTGNERMLQQQQQQQQLQQHQHAHTVRTHATMTPRSNMAPYAATRDAAALHASADDARREFMIAARLVTAVMMGVMLGVERRATQLNLGVRSITVLCVSAALMSVVATCGGMVVSPATRLALPMAIPHMFAVAGVVEAVAAVAACGVVASGVLAATALRRRDVRFAGGMSAVVGLSVGMGVACGAGLALLTAGFYLAGVAVMRGRGRRREVVRDRVSRNEWSGDGRENRIAEVVGPNMDSAM